MGEEAGSVGDAELVRRTRSGDARAFGLLVERYQRPAYAAALSVTRKHEDAEDAAQEAFMVALERIDQCRNPDRFAGWFLTIVRNRARNLIRRQSLREGEEIPTTTPADVPSPVEETERRELRRRLVDALNELPADRREVVILHDLEGWKHREIAERMDLPRGTVRSHLHYARRALREILGPVGAVDDEGDAVDGEEDGGSADAGR